jgi:hypothetical protein
MQRGKKTMAASGAEGVYNFRYSWHRIAHETLAVCDTAVGCPPLARPFTAGLSGPDFAKLLTDGWVPAGIVLGISAAGLHDTLVTTSSGPWGHGERGGAGLHQPDGSRAAGCAESAGADGARAGR